MTYPIDEEAFQVAQDAAWKALLENRANATICERSIIAYLTAISDKYVLVPRELTKEQYAAAGNALVSGRIRLSAHHDYLIDTVHTALIAEIDARMHKQNDQC